jgi:hypothetical protein
VRPSKHQKEDFLFLDSFCFVDWNDFITLQILTTHDLHLKFKSKNNYRHYIRSLYVNEYKKLNRMLENYTSDIEISNYIQSSMKQLNDVYTRLQRIY